MRKVQGELTSRRIKGEEVERKPEEKGTSAF